MEELDPVIVFNPAVFIRNVIRPMTIFRNIDRNIAIFLLPLDQGVVDTLRINFPSPRIQRNPRIGIGLEPPLDGLAFLRRFAGTIVVSGVVDVGRQVSPDIYGLTSSRLYAF